MLLDRWNFPLFSLNLQSDGTKINDLIEQRRRVQEAWERALYGVPDEY
ncbi:MAG: hypothetical protein ABSG41_21890 [Bryobacteraceae bacterium]|jgi:flagellin-specific chaperone FliS